MSHFVSLLSAMIVFYLFGVVFSFAPHVSALFDDLPCQHSEHAQRIVTSGGSLFDMGAFTAWLS